MMLEKTGKHGHIKPMPFERLTLLHTFYQPGYNVQMYTLKYVGHGITWLNDCE